ncbi:MAG: type II secretion system F family protein [Patescibacteria group bacterium]
MNFNYKARTKEGKVEMGSIDAFSREAAIDLLQKYNIFVTSLEEKTEKTSFFQKISFQRKVSKKELAVFFRQLSIMLESQVPIVQSLSSLAAETKKTVLRNTILEVSELVEGGVSLSEAFAVRSEVFSNFYVNLIRSGEASGKIASALYSISLHLERENDVASQVKQAIIYPVFLIGMLFFVIGIVVTQIVPKVEGLIIETGNTPTLFTSAMLKFYNFLGKYWWFLFLVLFFLVVSITIYFRTKEGQREYGEISLKVPFLGGLLKKVFLMRFASNVSTLLIAGVSINKVLKITEDTVDNVAYKRIISDVEEHVSGGEKLSVAMTRHPKYFTPFVLQIIRVGESTGKLDKTLMDIVSFYEKEIKRSIDLFSRLLEPIMIIILGAIVAVIAASVLSSIYGAIGTV